MRCLSRVLGVCLFVLPLIQAEVAWAGDTSIAETLFRRGLEAMQQNRFKEACEAFAGSNEADPSPGTEINLALCNEKQGKLASAWGWYRTAAGLAQQRGQAEREKIAREEAAKLEPRLHRLVLHVKAQPAGFAITRDGQPVPAAALGTDVPIDPGEHVLEATADGKKTWKHVVRIEPGPGTDRVEVPVLEDAPVARKDVEPAVGQVTTGGSTQRTIGFVAGGVGIAGAVAAAIFEVVALNEKSKSESLARDAESTTDPATKTALEESVSSHHKAAKNDELIAISTGIGAVVLIGVGVTLILTAPRSSSTTASSAPSPKSYIVPLIGRDNVGAGLVGTF